MSSNVQENRQDTLRRLSRQHGGVIRASQAIRAGVHPRTLYALRDSGVLERLERGLYRLAELPDIGDPDLVTVALKVRVGVICLISALAHHELTTQIPHEVWVALPRHTEYPRLRFPPIRVFWFSEQAMATGVGVQTIDGVPVRIFNAEKTIADCFKYRNKIGVDVALEALRFYCRRQRPNVDELIRSAKIDRVQKVIRPYLEAML
jgi:predicted transcriptional regulator of viral defense system